MNELEELLEQTIRRFVRPDARIVGLDTLDNVSLYWDALAELGLAIPEETFIRRFQEAGRYPGFKYMGFLLSLWRTGRLGSLHGSLLDQLLHGKVH